MNGRHGRLQGWRGCGPAVAGVLALTLAAAPRAAAFGVQLSNDARLDWETTVSYGFAVRAAGQSLTGLNNDVNKDDGNRSFERWDPVANRFSLLSEADLQWRDFGVFVRGTAFYDFVYMGKSNNDSPGTHNSFQGNGGSLDDSKKFNDDVEWSVGTRVELLDAFLYGEFEPAGAPTQVRVGRQVVNWGESLFLIGGVGTSQNPLDATKLNTPGTELKEVFLPTGQVYAQTTLAEVFTLAGFYKWEWDETRLNEAGTFFSTSDFLFEAGETILVPIPGVGNLSIDHVDDHEPADTGEWGVSTRYYSEALEGTEFGLYYLNYTEKIPMVKFRPTGGSYNSPHGGPWSDLVGAVPGLTAETAAQLDYVDGSSYYLDYAENVQLVGFSVSGAVGDANIGAEIVYRWDYPVAVNSSNPANLLKIDYEKAAMVRAVLNGLHLWGETFLSDAGTLTWEVGMDRVNGYSSAELANDKIAWGGAVKLNLTYFQVLPALDLDVPITLIVNPEGTSSYTGSFMEDSDSLAIGLNFTYNSVWKLDFTYTNYLHDTDRNPKADRDWLGVNLKYTF